MAFGSLRLFACTVSECDGVQLTAEAFEVSPVAVTRAFTQARSAALHRHDLTCSFRFIIEKLRRNIILPVMSIIRRNDGAMSTTEC